MYTASVFVGGSEYMLKYLKPFCICTARDQVVVDQVHLLHYLSLRIVDVFLLQLHLDLVIFFHSSVNRLRVRHEFYSDVHCNRQARISMPRAATHLNAQRWQEERWLHNRKQQTI